MKAEKALYFPNLRGYTLADAWKADADTTDVLRGKVSLVLLYSGQWAYRQVGTFLGPEGKVEGELGRLLGEGIEGMGLQRVDVNFEERRLRAGLVWLFLGGLKKMRREAEWGKYFVVRRGLGDEVRSDIGVVNGSVGYVYLVDWEGKIRWAANGEAVNDEREGLVNGAKKLVEQWKREVAPDMKGDGAKTSMDAANAAIA